jgi:hypothetical protein
MVGSAFGGEARDSEVSSTVRTVHMNQYSQMEILKTN